MLTYDCCVKVGELRRDGSIRPGLWTCKADFSNVETCRKERRTDESVAEASSVFDGLACAAKVIVFESIVCTRCLVEEDAVDS